MGIIKRKKDFNYFECFCLVAKLANEAATYLNTVIADYNYADQEKHLEHLHKLEHEADVLKHELSRNLAHEFVTPIEREDIATLSNGLDNIVDAIEDIMRKLYMFNVKTLRSEAIEFSELITTACKTFYSLIQELADFKNAKKAKSITEFVIDINTIENSGDKLHAKSIRRLYAEDNSSPERLIWTMLFEVFEACLDACEDAANTVESIVMKNT